jgi:hypothetical protein
MWIFLFIDDLEYLRKEREGREEKVRERERERERG